jgi:tetratricopeptide (TPR) repeat protein/tRNA A-37 threonylcarbamoyl transferase component Bud32
VIRERSVSHYKIVEQIGGGGMGEVFKAEDTKLKCYRALKFLSRDLLRDETSKQRFIREAQAASTLDHPNICSVHEIDETEDGQLFITMPFYEGRSLRERIAEGPMSVRDAFAVAFSVASGLAHAHAHGIVHRDIKPANVMLTSEGFVKIVDFGLAKLADRTRITRSNVAVGTVAYMSPEQTRGEPVDHRTDIWSLGVLLYEMLTGELPFAGDMDHALMYSIVNTPPKPIESLREDVPEGCRRIIDRCLEKDLARRYQSTEELLSDLRDLSRDMGWGSSIADATVMPIGTPSRPPSRRRAALGVVLVAVVLSLATMWALLRDRPGALYTTDLRIAVLPFENLIGTDYDPFVDGMFEAATRIASRLSREHHSSWVSDYVDVMKAPLPTESAAAGELGVNHLLTGSVQRYGDRHRLRLQLKDAADLHTMREATVGFDINTFAGLADSLVPALASVIDVAARAHLTSSELAASACFTAMGHLQQDERDVAESMFERSLAADSTFALAHLGLGRLARMNLERSGDDNWASKARRHLTRAASLDSTVVEPQLELARLFEELGDRAAAAKAASRALAIEPRDVEAPLLLGRLYREDKRLDEAEHVYRTSIEKNPDRWRVYRNLGLFYYFVDRLPEAIEAYETAYTLAPENSRVLNDLGGFHHLLGEWAQAREYFHKSFLLSPSCGNCTNVGTMLYYEGRFSEAAGYFKFAFEYCDTSFYQVWGNWASALYWAKGQRDNAIDAYRHAIAGASEVLRESPEDATALYHLIDYYGMIGDKERAYAAIERARPIADENVNVMYRSANAYEMFGERELALRALGDAIRHGYPVAEILNEPVFRELIKDQIFRRMIDESSPSRATSSESDS